MDTKEFLGLVLPSSGVYFAATPFDAGREGHKNVACHSFTQMEEQFHQWDAEGRTCFYGLAAFGKPYVDVEMPNGKTKRRYRVGENAESVKAFWLDLDVGESVPGKPPKYPSQLAAGEGIERFCNETGLPVPMLVSSGYGIHAYWTLTEPVPVTVWKATADRFKRLTMNRQVRADHGITADVARVLRPIGTHNWKKPATPQLVRVLVEAPRIEHKKFDTIVNDACRKFNVPEPTAKPSSKIKGINDQFLVGNDRDLPPSDPELIANKCRQIGFMRDTRGCLPEPTWYAAMQVLRLTTGGREICHEWSKGYDGYSEHETDTKLNQLEEGNFGPALCSTFEGRNPSGCEGCPFKAKISSPIQLGVKIEAKKEEAIDNLRTPLGAPTSKKFVVPTELGAFKRTDKGLFVEADGVMHKFYDYDLYPVAVLHDDNEGGAMIKVRHWLPQEGWREFDFPARDIADLRAFCKSMLDNHVQPYIDTQHAEFLRHYMDTWVRKLKEHARLHYQIDRMGWREDLDWAFILGTKAYYKGGTVASVGASDALGDMELKFRSAGNLAEWVKLTGHLAGPGMEAHAFAFSSAAWSGPLAPFAQFAGLIVAANGGQNVGKTTIANLASSVYGTDECNWISPQSSELSIYGALGVLRNIPTYIDEMTVANNDMMSRLIYSVANGSPRGRLKSDGAMAKAKSWATSLLMSLNGSVYAKLEQVKDVGSAEPEKNRVLEFDIPRIESFAGPATEIKRGVADHYGLAGPVYLAWLVEHREELSMQIRQVYDYFTQAVTAKDPPRFMYGTAAATIVGAQIAYSLGLSKIEPTKLISFAVQAIRAATKRITSAKRTASEILTDYLNATIASRIVVERLSNSPGGLQYRATKLPAANAKLISRLDLTEKRMWTSLSEFRSHLLSIREDVKAITEELVARGIVTNPEIKYTLGRYIAEYEGPKGDSTRCLEIDMDRPETEGVVETTHNARHEEDK